MFKEFLKKYKYLKRQEKLLNAESILLEECHNLLEFNKKEDNEKCIELNKIIEQLRKYYEKYYK